MALCSVRFSGISQLVKRSFWEKKELPGIFILLESFKTNSFGFWLGWGLVAECSLLPAVMGGGDSGGGGGLLPVGAALCCGA